MGGNGSLEEIEVAARLAHAHDFITAFPDQYETQVTSLYYILYII